MLRRETLIVNDYVLKRIDTIKGKYQEEDRQILRSALIYQQLYKIHFGKTIYVATILDEYGGEIGKIGPGDGCLTNQVLEKMFGSIDICHMHSAFHDAYGRFFKKYEKGRGYTYAIQEKNSPRWVKKCSLLGHITGFIWCVKNYSILKETFCLD